MKKSNKIDGLCEWLDFNKIQYSVVDQDIVDIPGFGKAFFQDTEKSSYKSIFRRNKDGELIFNSMEDPDVLINEGVDYIVFKFGKNFYYHDLHKEFALNILKYIGTRTTPLSDVKFVNLGVHTPFELLNGSFMPNMWVQKATYLGHSAIGICDKNTMAACFTFQKNCDAYGITPVFGYSMTVEDDDRKFEVKVYAQTNKGYRNMLRIQKAIMVDNVDNKTIHLDELLKRGEGNVLVMGKYTTQYMEDHPEVVSQLTKSFNGIYYQVDLSEYKAERIDIRVLESTKKYFRGQYKNLFFPRPVLISDCYYLDKDDAKNKIILNKISEGAAHEQSNDQYFKDIDDHFDIFQKTFGDNWDVQSLFEECCRNTIIIAEGAKARMDVTRNYMPKYDMTEEEKKKYGTVRNMFNQLLEDGLSRLAPKEKLEQYRNQMEYEKYIIESTDNIDYLLVQYDTCNWARKNNILVGCGRGSASGSLLLYLLGITLIDPIKYDLIFERFIIPERAGLSPAKTTIIGEDIDSCEYVQITLENGKTINVDVDAELIVIPSGSDKPIKIYADELECGDDVLFDNRDILFTLNEI